MLPNRSRSADKLTPRSGILTALQGFVDTVACHPDVKLGEEPEFCAIIRDLCDKAPSIAEAIARLVREREKSRPYPDSAISKRAALRNRQDPSYRLSKVVVRGSGVRDAEQDSPDAASVGKHPRSEDIKSFNSSPDEKITNTPTRTSTPCGSEGSAVEASANGTQSTLQEQLSQADQSSTPLPPVRDLIIHTTRTLHRLSEYQDGVPKKVHQRILLALQGDNPAALASLPCNQWSDGSMWVQILMRGSSHSRKVTILNMLEYIGAWQWYDIQVRSIQDAQSTAQGRPGSRRGAASKVLDSITSRGKWISGMGLVATEQHETSRPTFNNMSENERKSWRNTLQMQLSRGRKLHYMLVGKLGLGILFSPKIWDYTKMGFERLSTVIESIQAEPKHMRLLQILSHQMVCLVNDRPQMSEFYENLKQHNLLPGTDICELEALYPVDEKPLPNGTLDAALDSLNQIVKENVLEQSTLPDDEGLSVNGSEEITCNMFQQLRPGSWLDSWTIAAAMCLSDKPACVRHGLSVPLDEAGPDGHIQPKKRPLAGLAKIIPALRQEIKVSDGTVAPLMYYCPINHKNEHFSLLEIDVQQRTISHFDSMMPPNAVAGGSRVKSLVLEEFKKDGYEYAEIPTPQQKDGWSCGFRVVWNFQRLANGLPIGWSERTIDPEHMVLEIVEGLTAAAREHRMWRTRGAQKRRRTEKGSPKKSGEGVAENVIVLSD